MMQEAEEKRLARLKDLGVWPGSPGGLRADPAPRSGHEVPDHKISRQRVLSQMGSIPRARAIHRAFSQKGSIPSERADAARIGCLSYRSRPGRATSRVEPHPRPPRPRPGEQAWRKPWEPKPDRIAAASARPRRLRRRRPGRRGSRRGVAKEVPSRAASGASPETAAPLLPIPPWRSPPCFRAEEGHRGAAWQAALAAGRREGQRPFQEAAAPDRVAAPAPRPGALGKVSPRGRGVWPGLASLERPRASFWFRPCPVTGPLARFRTAVGPSFLAAASSSSLFRQSERLQAPDASPRGRGHALPPGY